MNILMLIAVCFTVTAAPSSGGWTEWNTVEGICLDTCKRLIVIGRTCTTDNSTCSGLPVKKAYQVECTGQFCHVKPPSKLTSSSNDADKLPNFGNGMGEAELPEDESREGMRQFEENRQELDDNDDIYSDDESSGDEGSGDEGLRATSEAESNTSAPKTLKATNDVVAVTTWILMSIAMVAVMVLLGAVFKTIRQGKGQSESLTSDATLQNKTANADKDQPVVFDNIAFDKEQCDKN